MDISVAQIEDRTGNPVCGGEISLDPSLGSDGPFPAHDRLLLEFRDRSGGLMVWPVVSLERCDNGFCQLGIGDLGAHFSGFSRSDIDTLLDVDGDFSLIRGGSRCGWIIGERMKVIWEFESFELHRRFSVAGMHLAITGRLAEREGEASNIWSGRQIRIESTLCWETLTILGFASAAPHWKFDKERPSVSRPPKRLPFLADCGIFA